MESRILVIGGTGKIGRHLAAASLNAGHPTAVLVRPSSADAGADPVKTKLLEELYNNGARLIYGDINDHESLVAAIEQTDVVISGIGHTSPEEVESQLKIMGAIKDVGNVKRFVPSEYGCNVELAERMLEPARSILGAKLRVRKALRASGIPHTIICSYWIHGFLLPKAGDSEADGPPVTRDMSKVAIKAVDDPRTINKVLYMRPRANLCSLDQLVSLGEKKIGKKPREMRKSSREKSKHPLSCSAFSRPWCTRRCWPGCRRRRASRSPSAAMMVMMQLRTTEWRRRSCIQAWCTSLSRSTSTGLLCDDRYPSINRDKQSVYK